MISNPRPIYIEKPPKSSVRQLKMGTRDAGITIDIDKDGVKINGYYSGLNERNTIFSIISKPLFITWEEFDKIKASTTKRKKKYKEFIGEIPDKKYLDTLPIVELNNKKFYIDSDRRERRQYDAPDKVVKF